MVICDLGMIDNLIVDQAFAYYIIVIREYRTLAINTVPNSVEW